MSWIIERDKDYKPLRMIWTGVGEQHSARNEELDKMVWRNSLPMRSMRKWAEKRGLIPNRDRNPF